MQSMNEIPLEQQMQIVPNGVYRHFKGGIYQLICIAKHSETLEPMVVYQNISDEEQTWIRPLSMWNEMVEHNGRVQPRFSLIAANIEDMDSRKLFGTIEEIVEVMEQNTPFSENNIVAYCHKKTGKVFRFSMRVLACAEGELDEEDLEPFEKEELSNWYSLNHEPADAYVSLPTDGLLNEYDVMQAFAYELRGPYAEKLVNTLQGKGSFRRFKSMLQSLRLTQQWHIYRDTCYRSEAREWCDAMGIDWKLNFSIKFPR